MVSILTTSHVFFIQFVHFRMYPPHLIVDTSCWMVNTWPCSDQPYLLLTLYLVYVCWRVWKLLIKKMAVLYQYDIWDFHSVERNYLVISEAIRTECSFETWNRKASVLCFIFCYEVKSFQEPCCINSIELKLPRKFCLGADFLVQIFEQWKLSKRCCM